MREVEEQAEAKNDADREPSSAQGVDGGGTVWAHDPVETLEGHVEDEEGGTERADEEDDRGEDTVPLLIRRHVQVQHHVQVPWQR